MAFCTHCGQPVKDTAKFCVHCGQTLGVAAPPAAAGPPPQPITHYPDLPAPPSLQRDNSPSAYHVPPAAFGSAVPLPRKASPITPRMAGLVALGALALMLLIGAVLALIRGGSGLPRGAEEALLQEVGSDFYLIRDTESHGNDIYCAHTVNPNGLVQTYGVQEQGGLWTVLSAEEGWRICDGYTASGFYDSFSSDPFEGMPHITD